MPHHSPTVRQIAYFLEVVRAGSFRNAAARMGITQPTLTAQIAAMEDTLGIRLLERTKSGAMPSPMGRALVGQAETVLHELSIFTDMARAGTEGPAGTHRLGVPPTLGPYFLPEVIGALHDAYPALRLHVREDAPRDLETKLIEGHHDLILTPLPLSASNISVEPLFDEPLILTSATDHPLAAKETVLEEDLRGESLLALQDRYRFFDQVQELAYRFGARLRREFEGTSLDTLRHMVGMGMGLGFLPALYVRSEIMPRQDVAVLHLSEPPAFRTVGLAFRRSASHRHLYRDMADLIRRICRQNLAKEVKVLAPEKDRAHSA